MRPFVCDLWKKKKRSKRPHFVHRKNVFWRGFFMFYDGFNRLEFAFRGGANKGGKVSLPRHADPSGRISRMSRSDTRKHPQQGLTGSARVLDASTFPSTFPLFNYTVARPRAFATTNYDVARVVSPLDFCSFVPIFTIPPIMKIACLPLVFTLRYVTSRPSSSLERG